MKRALIFLLVLGIIFTVFSLIFFTGYESEYIGLTKVYFNDIAINQFIPETDSTMYLTYNYGGKILDNEFYLGFDFDVGNWVDGFTPAGDYRVKGHVSGLVSESTSPVFVGEPFDVDVFLTWSGVTDDESPLPQLFVRDIHIRYEPFTFAGIINNNVSLYWDNSMKFEEVDNIVDFGVFILDFIKSLFVLIGNIFYSMGVFF